MFDRAFLLAVLLSTLGAAPLSADEEKAGETENETPVRAIRPTEEELQSYSLPRGNAPVVEEPALFDIAGVSMFAASAADIATTEIGLARGLEEGNPIASGRSLRVVHHVLGPTAVWWTTEKLRKSGRTKLALTLRIALLAAYSYASVQNVARVSGTTAAR